MTEMFKRSRRWLVLLGGFALVLTGNVFEHYPPGARSLAVLTFVEIGKDLGIGLLVAAAVSIMFDIWYQKQMVSDPLGEIEGKVKHVSSAIRDLGQEVADFNPILKSAQVNGINAIYRRFSGPEIIEWQRQVRETISVAEKYVLIMGRSLDDLLPEKRMQDGILPILRKLNEVPVLFIFADVFDKKSDYRKEAEERAGDDAISLYGRTRRSIRQLLDLVVESDYRLLISIRLAKNGPPFALFMTERSAIIEPYLPYLEGGSGIVYEARSMTTALISPAPLHHAHKLSFGKLWSNSRHVEDGIAEFLQRKSSEDPTVMERYHKYLEIASRLKMQESSVVTRAGLF